MIGLISRHSTSTFRASSQVPRIAIGVAFAKPQPRYFTSHTVSSPIMSSAQQAAVPKRKVGKKFVIACDGEPLIDFVAPEQ